MAMTITSKQWIAWVQRSLNRLLGSALITDGSDTEEYRENVKEFRFAYVLGSSAEVDRPTQDALIRANYLTQEYVAWAQRAFNKVGASVSAPVTGIVDSNTKAAILSFQGYVGLPDDGWLGAETETFLMRESGMTPPGHISAGVRPIPRPRVPTRPIDPLPPEKRMDRVINTVLYEIQANPRIYPNVQQRKRVTCLMLKLKKKQRGEWISGKRVDDRYIPKGAGNYPRLYAFGTGSMSHAGGAAVQDLELSALETLRRSVLRLPADKRTEHEALRKIVLNLDYDIEGALDSINNIYNVHGNTNIGAALLHKWGMDKQSRPESILSCYT